MNYEISDVIEPLPGGWHTVRRVLVKDTTLKLTCPNCGNKDPEKFKAEARGATLHGFWCMNCHPR